MKKIAFVLAGIILLVCLYAGWVFLGPASRFSSKIKYFYIHTNNSGKAEILKSLEQDSIVIHPSAFSWLAGQVNYWKQIKPGKYQIKADNSLLDIVRILKNGRQSPVNLVITKLRTKEDFASLTGRKFECDSLAVIRYLNNPDSLSKYQLDSNTVMTAVFPDTYTFFWNTTPDKIFTKLIRKYNSFWTPENMQSAKEKGLTPQTAYVLASIIEEETNKNNEKGNIASVYLNRIKVGMNLGADPTVKFALRDFSLKRIYNKHLSVESPYNTYRIKGLPPGPICTPSATTVQAVLDSPETNYLYFVAKSDFSGYHTFASTYTEHLKYAREYQEALNRYMQRTQPAKDNLEQ